MTQKFIRPHFTSLRVEVTSKCNLKCKYCFANSTMLERKEKDMEFSKIKYLLTMARKSNIKKILWSGGEPFCRDNFISILDESYGIKTSFVTNGELITRDHMSAISEMPHVNRIRFSIDGFDGHNIVRKGSSWKRVINNIALCKEILPKVSIVPQTTATLHTMHEIPALLSEIDKLGADRWRMFMLRFSGRISRGAIGVNSHYYNKYIELIAEIAKYSKDKNISMQIEVDGGYQSDLDSVLQKKDPPIVTANTNPCQYLQHVLTIRSNGDISACPFFELELGNIGNFKSIHEMENHIPLIAWRNQRLSNLEKCFECRYSKICSGGCRKTAVDLLGSFYAEDPVFCYIMPKIEKIVWPELSLREQKHYQNLINEKGAIPAWDSKGLDMLLDDFFNSKSNYVNTSKKVC